MRRYRSKSRRASSLLPRKSPAGCGAGSLAVAASSTAPLRRKHDPVVALDRGPGLRATSAAASAGSRSAGSPMPPPGRCGARRSSLVARGRRQIGVARKWRRNGLKRLNPRPEMVWARKPRTHNIWYHGRAADRARLPWSARMSKLCEFRISVPLHRSARKWGASGRPRSASAGYIVARAPADGWA